MGTDPTNPNYEPGNECSTCVDLLFDGVTPKYVESHIIDISDCPSSPFTVTNGVSLLTQSVNPCLWIGALGLWIVQWVLRPADSILSVTQVGAFAFHHISGTICQFVFTNQNVCGIGLAVGSGGTGEIFWGPTIGP